MGDRASRLATRASAHPVDVSTADFTLGQNSKLQLTKGQLGFAPLAIAVSNQGPFWIHIPAAPSAYQWVPPFTFGAVVPVPGEVPIFITSSDLPAIAAGAVAPTSSATADITAFAAPLPPSPGFPYQPSASGYGVAFPLVSRPAGTYTFQVPRSQAKGLTVFLHLVSGAGSLIASIQDVDPAGGIPSSSLNVLSTLGTGAPNDKQLTVYPGLTAVANSIANAALGGSPVISLAISVNSLLMSVGYATLL